MQGIAAYVPAPESASTAVEWSQYVDTHWSEREGDDPVPPTYYCASPQAEGHTEEAVRAALDGQAGELIRLPRIESLESALDQVRDARSSGLVASLIGLPREFATDMGKRILRRSPCETLVLLSGSVKPGAVRRVLAIVSDSAHDQFVLESAATLAYAHPEGHLTLATIEDDVGGGAKGLGERELQHVLRGAGIENPDAVEVKVVVDNHPVRGVVRAFDEHDLVLVGATNLDMVKSLGATLGDATIGVLKRQPPLRRRSLPDWIPQVNPADYAELAQTLRQGSRWTADFVVMLGLASAIATLGLIQDSPAVVIGSMLLAPLMTPMLGMGLGIAQANGRMSRLSGRSIALGLLLTLLISYAFGHLAFRETLSPEVIARTSPNLLDLGIALFAAAAAAFALARPALSGAVAGVAIATALVPPVCACGVALARGYFLEAFGAGALFLTNLLAIVVASAGTFALMGVVVPHTFSRAKRLARNSMVGLTALLLVMAVPLGFALKGQIDEGRAMPLAYPVTRAVAHAVISRVAAEEGAEVMLLGRSPVTEGVAVYVASHRTLGKDFRDEIRRIVREEMADDALPVYVVVVKSAMDEWNAGEESRPR